MDVSRDDKIKQTLDNAVNGLMKLRFPFFSIRVHAFSAEHLPRHRYSRPEVSFIKGCKELLQQHHLHDLIAFLLTPPEKPFVTHALKTPHSKLTRFLIVFTRKFQ